MLNECIKIKARMDDCAYSDGNRSIKLEQVQVVIGKINATIA